MNAAQQIAIRHFGKRAVTALARKGIQIIGLQALPNVNRDLAFVDADTGYVVNDNGTGRVWTYADVKKAEAA